MGLFLTPSRGRPCRWIIPAGARHSVTLDVGHVSAQGQLEAEPEGVPEPWKNLRNRTDNRNNELGRTRVRLPRGTCPIPPSKGTIHDTELDSGRPARDALHGDLGGNQAVESAVSTPGLDVWVYSQPHEGAAHGGDVHYVSLCGGGVITRMIVADVSGHGESVAEFSGMLRSLLRRNINRKSQTRLVAASTSSSPHTPSCGDSPRRSWRPTWPIVTSLRSVTPGIPARSGTDLRSGNGAS